MNPINTLAVESAFNDLIDELKHIKNLNEITENYQQNAKLLTENLELFFKNTKEKDLRVLTSLNDAISVTKNTNDDLRVEIDKLKSHTGTFVESVNFIHSIESSLNNQIEEVRNRVKETAETIKSATSNSSTQMINALTTQAAEITENIDEKTSRRITEFSNRIEERLDTQIKETNNKTKETVETIKSAASNSSTQMINALTTQAAEITESIDEKTSRRITEFGNRIEERLNDKINNLNKKVTNVSILNYILLFLLLTSITLNIVL